MQRVRLTIAVGIALLLGVSGAPRPSLSQDVQRIAAIVNDAVISGYDLERRLDLVIRSTEMPDDRETRRQLRPKVLEILIDEKLQLQEAKRLNIQVSEREMGVAMRRIEEQNDLPQGAFDNFIRANGIDRDSLLGQIRAQISWSKVLRRRLPPLAEDEVDEALSKVEANVGKPEYEVSEIFIPVDGPAKAAEARQIAIDLVQQIRAGTPFAAAARQFSRGPTAASGGQVGWLKPGQVAAEIDIALQGMAVNAVSDPIETPTGYTILQLHQRRRLLTADPNQARVSLRQLLLTLPENASESAIQARRDEARAIVGSVSDCGALETVAELREGVDYLDLGRLSLAHLSAVVRQAVEALPVGSFSEPVSTPAGLMLLMVCERQEPEVQTPTRETVIRALTRRKMARIAQRHIRDLRRDALVEYR
ncbi:MAG: peptidylprolyl isomerase [Alphaproteobacteria bacterium]|jgi:peptidyl-prolyl cis-trans isomerase SurA|nr:peptidylprolyl isomerase [Alphaproteobacteria bacterium]